MKATLSIRTAVRGSTSYLRIPSRFSISRTTPTRLSHPTSTKATFSTSTRLLLPSDDPGGKPNTGQHRTVYDDFFNILESSDPSSTISISSTSQTSLTLHDGLVLSEPVVILNNQVFLWDHPKLNQDYAVPSGIGWEAWLGIEKLNPGTKLKVSQKIKEVFGIFEIVDDRPEIVLFGTGKRVLPPPGPVREYLNGLGIQLDVQSTHDAASTYNMLTEEGRKVAAILIPAEESPKRRFTPESLQRLLSGQD
ncbi:uncharacterized protein UTRI_00308_B [Ustilago trichophora]|uniref:NADH dehydrogenase [ubiquinone] 1 alpha subcomplex assembly factor 3 n=1 Tax=Ustilago trichophora TaxID=86804 RepID=A0A5C3DQT1_9BASI|nr:uncharacterized protein UTRI_00308_B [Ustilago trichophora]